MEKEKFGLFLESLTYATNYKVLDFGKDKEEITEVAERNGLTVPSRDLAIFKGVYALIDIENKNGCTLPMEEVTASLGTLKGKAVDFDHLRKKIVGYWLEGEVVGDEIVSYGVFFKSNLEDDFETISNLMNDGNLKISFEAWGTKVEKESGSYDLIDIEWAGGALLIDTKPAFGDRAEVLEMAKKDKKVLEFAKVMKAPTEFLHDRNEKASTKKVKVLENSRFHIYEFDIIQRLVDEVGNPNSQEDFGYHDILAIDFIVGVVKTKWISFDDEDNNAFFTIYLTPRAEEGKEIDTKVLKIEEQSSKNSEDTSEKSSSRGDSADKIKNDSVEENTKMEKQIKELQEAVAKLNAQKEIDAKEIASLKEKITETETALEESKTQAESANVKVTEIEKTLEESKENFETEKAEAIENAKVETAKLAERRTEIGDFGKEISDEDILDDAKYEVSLLKKENAELKVKAGKVNETASTKDKDTQLDVGSKETKTEVSKKQDKVREYAFGKKAE